MTSVKNFKMFLYFSSFRIFLYLIAAFFFIFFCNEESKAGTWTPQQRDLLADQAAFRLAKELKILKTQNHHLVLVARRGSDQSRWPWIKSNYQLKKVGSQYSLDYTVFDFLLKSSIRLDHQDISYFSHVGIALVDEVTDPSAPTWKFIHKLRFIKKDPSERSRSGIFVQSLKEFFSDSPLTYDFKIIVLSRSIESQMFENLQLPSESMANTLNLEKYNELADPFTGQEQNSNTWVLYQIIAALLKPEEVFQKGIPLVREQLYQLNYSPDFISVRALPMAYQWALYNNVFRFPFKLLGPFKHFEQYAYLDTLVSENQKFKYYGVVAPAVTVGSIERFLIAHHWMLNFIEFVD